MGCPTRTAAGDVAHAAVARVRRMAGGQAIDLASVAVELSLPELRVHAHPQDRGADPGRRVTGAACGTGLDQDHHARLDRFAKFSGLAFQVVDDLLDVQASTATLGKTAGKDAVQNKPTYVSVLGMARSRELAEELRCEALAALEPLGPQARRLRQLNRFHRRAVALAKVFSAKSSRPRPSETLSQLSRTTMYPLLDTVGDPEALRKLERKALSRLAAEVRVWQASC